jgi:hypothetical protein
LFYLFQEERVFNRLVVDIAHYAKGIDPLPLHEANVQLVILKVDDLFLRNARLLVNAGMPVAAYHWIDPTVVAGQQATSTLKILHASKLPVVAIFADFEQWWSNWDEWNRANQNKLPWEMVSRFSGAKLSSHAKKVFERFAASRWKTFGYTRASFVREHAPKAGSWMPQYRWWLADYLSLGKQALTWDRLQTEILPRVTFFPELPPGISEAGVIGHQFTGDELSLPGLYENYERAQASAADLSLFDEHFLGEIGAVPDPQPLPAKQYDAVVTASPSLRVRSGPGLTFEHLYSLSRGEAVELSEIRDGWGKLRSFSEEWCSAEYLEIITATVPPVDDEDEPIEEPVEVDFPGVTYQAVRRFNANCHILVIELAGKRFHVTPFTGFRTVSQAARQLGAQIVINGDTWDQRVPSSIAASDGVFYQRQQKDYRPWINISRDNQVTFAWRKPANLYNAVSGDRYLIQDGKYNEAITNITKDPRTAVGLIPPGRLVLLVADGRSSASAGLSFREAATIFQELGVTTAINLDGGGSSALWIKNRIVNVPIDEGLPGKERAVANHLCVFI